MSQQTFAIFDRESGSSHDEYKSSLEQVQEQLSKYGLSGNQSKVFIYLEKYIEEKQSDKNTLSDYKKHTY